MSKSKCKHAGKKSFNGKTYLLKDIAYNKIDAEEIVGELREKGYGARMTKRSGKCFGYGRMQNYAIYGRKKR